MTKATMKVDPEKGTNETTVQKDFWDDEVKFEAVLTRKRPGTFAIMRVAKWTQEGIGEQSQFVLRHPRIVQPGDSTDTTTMTWTWERGHLSEDEVPADVFRWAWREVLA